MWKLMLYFEALLASPHLGNSSAKALPVVKPVVKPVVMSKLTMKALGVGIGLGAVLVIILTICIYFCYSKMKKIKSERLDDESPSNSKLEYLGVEPKKLKGNESLDSPRSVMMSTISASTDDCCSNKSFSYEELARATNNFASANLLGQGGFGYVHKGVLPNGKEVGVKQMKFGSEQGEREFQAEVDTISRVHHKHLVSLVGYCICGDERILVYEFVPNKTLDFHLHEAKTPMSWERRLKVALGAAKGLTYLHEDCRPKIIHRDIKASNILLDENFEPKVADFGLAKFFYDTDTHVSTRVMGTFGYLAPEYASSGKLTERSDVYSFGIVLVELITGRRPIDKGQRSMDDSMIEWARPLLREALETGNVERLIDPNLKYYNSSEMSQMVACAAFCVQHSARRRPRMSQIVDALEGNLSIDELCNGLSFASSATCGSSDNGRSKEELNKFRKLVFESQDELTSTSESSAINSDLSRNTYSFSIEIQTNPDSKNHDGDILERPLL